MRAVLLFLLTLTGLTYRPVRSARAELPRYERSILEETENSRCPENAYSAEKTRTGILIVGTEWWPRSKDFSLATVQRDLSRLLLNQGYDVYVTVFDPSEQEMEDAKNHGVRLITSEQLPTSRVIPNVERLLLHKAVFPELHKYINITVVIGYANIEGAADAARSIKDCLFRDASFVLLITYIPEDTDMKPSDVEDHEYDILEHANIASVVMSLGPAIYLHFENKFRDLFKKPTHSEFFPGFDDILLKTMTTPPDIQEGPIEILMFDFSSTTALNCSNNLQHVALAVGKVADYFSGDRKIKLKIRGLSDEVGQACKESLREIIRSDYVSIHPYPYSENILFKVRKDFRQCHLLLFAPWRDPFGIISFLASAAGVPTLSTEHSGFSEFIKRDMKHHYNIVIVNELGVHVNTLKATEKWQRKIIDVLKDPTVYENFLVNAQKLKHDLKKSIISGTIAKSRKMVSAILQNETGIGRPKCVERRGKWKVEKTEGYDKSRRSMVEKADIYGLCLTQNGSLQIDVTVENATPKVVEKVKDQLFKKIKTCEDLPAVQKYLHGLGIKCLYTLVNSLSIFVLVPNVQSLDTLWAYYKNNSLKRLVQTDIMNIEAYEKLDEGGIMFDVSIERWRYRRCRLELLYLNQDPDRKHAEVTLTDKNIITLVIIMLFEWTLVVMINSFQTGRSGAIIELDNTGVRARASFASLECLLLLGVDPKLEVTASVKEFLRHILHANSVTVSRGKNINILYLMVNLTSKTQNVILSRLETLAFLGLRKYVFVNPEILTGVIISATVLEEELSRGNYIPVESLSTNTFNLKTKSLLPFKLISRQSTNFYINYSFDLALGVHQTLRKQLKHSHTEIISLRESLRDSERKRVVAESQLKEKVDKFDSAEKKIEFQSNEIEKMLDTQKEKNSKVSELMGKISEYKQDNNVLSGQLEESEHEKTVNKQRHTKELDDVEKQKKALDVKIKTLQTTNSEREAQVKELRVKLEKVQRERETGFYEFIADMLQEQHSKQLLLNVEEQLKNLVQNESLTFLKIPISSAVHREIIECISILYGLEYKIPPTRNAVVVHKTPWTKSQPPLVSSTTYWKHTKPSRKGNGWWAQELGTKEAGSDPLHFDCPNDVLWDGCQLLISDTNNHRIHILNSNNTVTGFLRFDEHFRNPFRPRSITISPDGHLFIYDLGNNQIICCDQNKSITNHFALSSAVDIRSFAFLGGFIYGIDKNSDSLLKYDAKNGKIVRKVKDPSREPYGIAAAKTNQLFVSDIKNHVICVFDTDLNFLKSYCTKDTRDGELNMPLGIDFDHYGNIYVCDRENHRIVKLEQDGKFICNLFEGDVYGPRWIAVNDDISAIAVTHSDWVDGHGWKFIHKVSVYYLST